MNRFTPDPGPLATRDLPTFAVVGRVNRGKSSIIATLAEDDSIAISPLPGTTRVATSYDVTLEGPEERGNGQGLGNR